VATPQTQSVRLARVLGPFEAFSLVVSAVLGSSIFIVPATVAGDVPFLAGIVGVWIAGGVFSLMGALTYAELGAMLPEAGGGYVYLEEAFGPAWSFLFVWTDFLLVRAGAAAAISVGFGAYAATLFPLPPAVYAIALILFIGLLNVLGTKLSGMVQVLGTVFKAGAILLVIALPWLYFSRVHTDYLRPVLPPLGTAGVGKAFMAALVPVLWSFGGWDQLSHMAEEVRNPEKNIARAFGFGLVAVSLLFAGAAVSYQLIFPIGRVAHSQAIASDFFRVFWGPSGAVVIAAIVLFSALTSAHMALMSGSRSCFAIGRAGLFPAWTGRLHPRFGTPANSVIALTAWACLLVGGNALYPSASRPLYVVLFTYVMVGLLLFSSLVFAAAIRLRVTHPEWKRPYRVSGYPFTPAISIVVSLGLLVSMLADSTAEACTGLAIILAGYPVYVYSKNGLRHSKNRVRA
jgi:APA family basic amino acid/polyamine antiporter